MKLGDLWVKLGLKKEEFTKGIKEADGEIKKFSGGMKSLSVAAKVAWAAVAAAVVKFARDAVQMTQKWGDQWNQTMAGVKSAYGTFVRQLSSGAGWDNLFQNMAEAYRKGKELAAVLDEIFERKVSFGYQEAATEKEIEQWRAVMMDQSKSIKDREAAAQKIIELEETLGQVKKGIYNDEAAAMRDQFALQTGLNNDQIQFLVREYNQNRDIIKQSRDYLAERKRLQNELVSANVNLGIGPTSGSSFRMLDERRKNAETALAQLESNTTQYVKDVAALTQMYDRGNDELVDGMAKAETAAIRVDTEVLQAQRRAKAFLGRVNAADSTDGGGTKTNSQLEEAKRIQDRARESAKGELQILTEKYGQEKALLEAFGMDVEALTQEYEKNISSLLDVPLKKMEELDDIVVDLDIELDDDPVQEFLDKLEEDQQRMQELVEDLRSTAIQGFSDAVQELSDQFAGLSDINAGKIFQALLTPLADMAIKEGEILIAEGIGVEAVKKALESLNGIAAIAAGTALVAIGAAAKSGLAALANKGTATTSYAAAGASSPMTQTIQTEMTVYVTGRISGNDILLSGQKTQNNLNR